MWVFKQVLIRRHLLVAYSHASTFLLLFFSHYQRFSCGGTGVAVLHTVESGAYITAVASAELCLLMWSLLYLCCWFFLKRTHPRRWP